MLSITAAAGEYLVTMLDHVDASADRAVRLAVGPDGLTAAIDVERPGDEWFEHGGRRVLLLDRQAAAALSDRVLDLHATSDGKRLGLS
jgi:hypothetical protein